VKTLKKYMNILLTGATGFLGGELLVSLSQHSNVDKIYCLVRAKNKEDGLCRLQKVFNLHNDKFDTTKVIPVIGDLLDQNLSQSLINDPELKDIDTVIHSAANTSFSRIYDDLIERININGLKEILIFSQQLKKLKTFVYVGTATICGKGMTNTVVKEEDSPNLESKHFVKYTYTKMLGEIAVREFIPEEKVLIVRPSIIMGDSRPWVPRSYVIMWAVETINLLRLIPVNAIAPLDMIPVDYASKAIIELLFIQQRKHSVYHVSSGVHSATSALKMADVIKEYYPDKPDFKFVKKGLINQMKNWSRGRLQEDSELHNYSKYLDYWSDMLGDKSRLRIIFAGLEPYLEFMELGQIFDNSRLIHETNIGYPQSAHDYLNTCLPYFEKIDIFEGALDP